MSETQDSIFGPGGAYAQAYGLFNCAQACGTMVGPAFAGLVYAKAGWTAAVCALAGFCASGAVGIVS